MRDLGSRSRACEKRPRYADTVSRAHLLPGSSDPARQFSDARGTNQLHLGALAIGCAGRLSRYTPGMGVGEILGVVFSLALWLGPPILLILQFRSGTIRWGRGFGSIHAKRSETPSMFWAIFVFELVVMMAVDAGMIIVAVRGR